MNAAELMDTLLYQVYEYQHNGIMMNRGEFNSRVGALPDCIVGVDEIPPRNITDTPTNGYCDLLLFFIIFIYYCLLNGRNFHNNNCTCVASAGCCSIVDYCLTPHEKLDLLTKFKITYVRELFQSSGCVGEMDPPSCILDNYLLSWHLEWPNHEMVREYLQTPPRTQRAKHKRYDLDSIPLNYVSSPEVISQIEKAISQL